MIRRHTVIDVVSVEVAVVLLTGHGGTGDIDCVVPDVIVEPADRVTPDPAIGLDPLTHVDAEAGDADGIRRVWSASEVHAVRRRLTGVHDREHRSGEHCGRWKDTSQSARTEQVGQKRTESHRISFQDGPTAFSFSSRFVEE